MSIKENRETVLFNLIKEKDDYLKNVIFQMTHYIKTHSDKSLSDLISLLLFLMTCGDKTFKLEGEDCIGIKNLKGVAYKENIEPSLFIGYLQDKLKSFFDEDIKSFYRIMLNISEDEDFFSIENLYLMKEFESLKINYPNNNRLYGEIASKLLIDFDTNFWNGNTSLLQIDKYAFIYDMLCELEVIKEDEDASCNEKQNKISKYLYSYNSFIEKYSIQIMRKS